MAARRTRAPRRARLGVPVRVVKHIERLGLYSERDYIEWCRARSFRPAFQKTWSELEREWCAHGREFSAARARCKVDRDPAKLLSGVCAGYLEARDIARPRWRALAERIENAALTGADREALQELVEAAQRRGNLLLAEGLFGGDTYPFLDGLVALARSRGAWIRAPRTWRARSHNARRQFASLIRHLVARYPVPAFLDAAWVRADAAGQRYRDWFVRLATGRSLRDVECPIELTKRIVHHFLRAPDDYAVEHALRWGQVRALGGDARLCDALLATRLGTSFEHEAFWISVIRFFVASPQLHLAQVGPIVDYLQYQRFECEEVFVARGVRERRRPVRPNLSMNGRTVASLLRQVERWHRELGRAGGSGRRWERSGIGELTLETGVPGRSLRIWRIRELLSAAELLQEGRDMRNCVASYASSCGRGSCSIWTMELHSFEGVHKRLTIEVSARGVIVGARRRCNRLLSAQDRLILQQWAEREGLQLSQWL